MFFRNFVEEKLGSKYVEGRSIEFAKSFEESGPGTPIFFILSPGVDPLKDVEALGKKIGFTTDNKNLHNVSLGQVRIFLFFAFVSFSAYYKTLLTLKNKHQKTDIKYKHKVAHDLYIFIHLYLFNLI